MPTIFTHALLPMIASSALPGRAISPRLLVAGMVVAMLPDADVAGRLFDVPHTADLGHRGVTHTLVFAFLVGCIGAVASKTMQSSREAAFLFLSASTLSHALTDMLTDGGKGIMLLWPLHEVRMKFPFHPVEVSPVGLKALESDRIWIVLLSEMRWLLIPATLIALIFRLALNSRRRRAH
jgi:inner membrane protein